MKLTALTLSTLLAAPLGAQLHAPEVTTPWIGYETAAYPNGLSPTASALVDLDGDGHLDLATVSYPVNAQLSILFGDGLGGFSPPVTHALPEGSRGLEAVDLDGDGDVDLLATLFGAGWNGTTVALFDNPGDGAFGPPQQIEVGKAPVGIAVADVDGEGNLDIVVAHQGSSLGLVLNDGAGGFLPPQVVVLAFGTLDVEAGDLDGDGDIDLVVGYSSKQISVLENIGIGFAPAVSYASIPTGSFTSNANVHLADVDADGDLDALYSSASTGNAPGGIGYGAIALFRNLGDGTLAAPETIPMHPDGAGASDIAVADVTGDGWPDLVAPSGGVLWCLIPGDGAGSFLPAVTHFAGDAPVAAEAGDLNGDGQPEVVIVGQGSMEACVYQNPGDGAFAEPLLQDLVDSTLAPVSSTELAGDDIDGDGDLDVVIGYSANFQGTYGISVKRNLGDGTLGPAELYSEPTFPQELILADVNGDGFPDMLYIDDPSFANPRFRRRLNRGDGTFDPPLTAPGSFCGYEPDLKAADIDADGDLDVLVAECLDRVYVYRNFGGNFELPQSHTVSNSVDAFAIGDLDGDGFADLVTNSGSQGYVEISLGNGNGTFQPPFEQVCGRASSAIEIADLSGDGIPDLAVAYQLDGDGVSVLHGWGDGTFKPSLDYHGSYSGYTDNVTVADLDADGDLDLLTANRNSQDISYWRNRGDGTYDEFVRYGAGRAAASLVPGDWTGDGRVDLGVLVEPLGGLGSWYYPALAILDGREAPWTDLGQGLAGAAGEPVLVGTGSLAPGTKLELSLANALGGSLAFHVIGFGELTIPLLGGVLVPTPDAFVALPTDLAGEGGYSLTWPATTPSGFELYFQTWVLDASAPQAVAASNAVRGTQP